MITKEVLATLKKLGKPQTAAIYRRHGAGDNVFGTLTSEIAKLRKKIKVNHELADELWSTGNAEARVLAIQIADPKRVTKTFADRLLRDGPVRFIGGYLSDLVAQSPVADQTMRAWMKSPQEYTREMGYGILSARLKSDPEFTVSDREPRPDSSRPPSPTFVVGIHADSQAIQDRTQPSCRAWREHPPRVSRPSSGRLTSC